MVSTPQITFAGELLNVHFEHFGVGAYPLFLKIKALPESTVHYHRDSATYTISAPARFAPMLGVQVPDSDRGFLPMPEYMFEDQSIVTQMALDAKRFACWSDCGWGKTPLQLEFARQVIHRTGGRYLQFTLNDIVPQFITEARKFYGDLLQMVRLNTREEMRAFCRGDMDPAIKLAITNYEKMNHEEGDQVVSEMRLLAGVGLDESSRLKTGGGTQKWALIKSCKGIEYKLSCTATPAPNETSEFASQASFLEKIRDEGDIIWTYFQRDETTHRWTVKRHARKAFFEFMASWSIYIRDPKRYGWRMNQVEVPDPEILVHRLPLGDEQRQAMGIHVTDAAGQRSLFPVNATNAIQRNKLAQIAKGFAYLKGENGKFRRIVSAKPAFIAKGVKKEVKEGLQVLVWTVFDAESVILSEQLTKAGVKHELLTGKTSAEDRVRLTNAFCDGSLPVLVTRASMLGYGRNFQCCGSMWFSGWSDSYESYYQAVRRAVRYGQERSVRVHLPVIEELEGDQLDNIFHKQAQHESSIAEMENNYIEIVQKRRSA